MTAAQQPVKPAYDQFQAETSRIPFVKIPKAVLEATMHDELATIWQRVYAYIMRYAWGNYSFHAVNDDGTPRLQRDCAKELDIPKQAVSKAIRYGITRGYLQDEIKILYPLLAPVLGNCKKVAPLGDFLYSTFVEEWKVANSTTFSQLEVARSTVKSIQKVILSDYKKWRTAATNGGAPLYEIKQIIKIEEPTDGRAEKIAPVVEDRPAPEPPARPQEGDLKINETPTPSGNGKDTPLRTQLRAFLAGRPITTLLDDAIFERIAAWIPDEEHLERFQRAADAVRNPRKWPIYETVARQIHERGTIPKPLPDEESEIARAAREYREWLDGEQGKNARKTDTGAS